VRKGPLLLAAALVAACSKTPEPEPGKPPAAAAPPAKSVAAAAPTQARPAAGPAELEWDVPAGWETAPNPSTMRKATYKIKKAEGDPEGAELSVSQVGGSLEKNIERWAGQFEQKPGETPKQTQRTVGDLKVTVVEIRGAFLGSGMPGMPATEPKAGWALLGAIAEVPGQTAPWFFKMTGPEKTISSARGDFDKMIDSLRPK
jgi:hypothetical protein